MPDEVPVGPSQPRVVSLKIVVPRIPGDIFAIMKRFGDGAAGSVRQPLQIVGQHRVVLGSLFVQ